MLKSRLHMEHCLLSQLVLFSTNMPLGEWFREIRNWLLPHPGKRSLRGYLLTSRVAPHPTPPLIPQEIKPTCHCPEAALWWHSFPWEHSSIARLGCPGNRLEWPHQSVGATRVAWTEEPRGDGPAPWPTLCWETGKWIAAGTEEREQRGFVLLHVSGKLKSQEPNQVTEKAKTN